MPTRSPTLALWLALAGLPAAELVPRGAVFELQEPWKAHPGDDPRWAAPEFDDSAWTRTHTIRGHEGFVWYRQRIHLPKELPDPLALWVPVVFSAAEFFIDGQRLGTHGDPDRRWTHQSNLTTPIAIPATATADGVVVIALRLRQVSVGPGLPRQALIGSASAIQKEADAGEFDVWRRALAGIFVSLVKLAAVAAALLYWRGRSNRRESLWFALLGVGYLPSDIEAWRSITGGPQWWLMAIPPLRAAGMYGAWRLFDLRPQPPRWLIPLMAAFVAFAAVERLGAFPQGLGAPVFMTLQLGIAARLVWAVRQRWKWEGSWLLWMFIPWFAYTIALSAMLVDVFLTAWAGRQMNLTQTGVTLLSAPLRVTLLQVSEMASIGTIAIVVLLRLTRERQRVAGELEAARQMQSLLLPDSRVQTPGLAVEAHYSPAQQVGGDFYWIRPLGDGGSLVAVGDVSGKGLRAALLVSVALGILQNEPSASPAAVLAALNRGLARRTGGGFVTCCCAHFRADGEVTVANAGHLAPYVDGEELALDAGLPLGLAAEIEYAEATTRGQRFTFLSDGVVEAATETGELFGFERTRAVSTQPAAAIAAAAQQWGQNDDITVVTVRRNLA